MPQSMSPVMAIRVRAKRKEELDESSIFEHDAVRHIIRSSKDTVKGVGYERNGKQR
jgi:hypothetical protein